MITVSAVVLCSVRYTFKYLLRLLISTESDILYLQIDSHCERNSHVSINPLPEPCDAHECECECDIKLGDILGDIFNVLHTCRMRAC
jgi:hypothetical protein